MPAWALPGADAHARAEARAQQAREAAQRDADIPRIASMAVAAAQQEKASWTRADLIAHLGRMMPRVAGDPAAEAALLEQLADRVLAQEFGSLECLEAPDVVAVPEYLKRMDGESVYRRHGTSRYATRTQLAAEEQLAALAGAGGAPGLPPEQVAQQLGADADELAGALEYGTGDAARTLGASGLRVDQGAAVSYGLTGDHLASVINAPAGAGKTTTAAAAAKLWEQAGGRVIGVTPSQASRNVLAEAGVGESYNFANFLGHLPQGRGLRGPVNFGPGTLIVADEASMFSTADLLDILRLAGERGARVLLIGDTEQLEAVESGGGMRLVATERGYARLFEPVRFTAQWERGASLQLRAGEASALRAYADHGRLRAAPLEEILDSASQAYVARTLQGRDVLMVVQDHATRRELNRRVRGELRHLGKVDSGRSAEIADKQQASAGDLVACTLNDNRQPVGGGQTLSNRHQLQLMRITDDGRLVLRRVLSTDAQTGARRLSSHEFTYGDRSRFDLGYAVTQHVAQGRTVWGGMDVVTGSERRQGSYVAASRGTDLNEFYIAIPDPKTADPRPGSRGT